MMLKVQIQKRNKQAHIPAYSTPGSAGVDLHACLDAPQTVAPGQTCLIPTGLSMAIPEGYEGQVRPRSGIALKTTLFIPNSPGTIDSDYRGEVKIIISNWGTEPIEITHGQRIAQMVFQKVEQASFEEVDSLDETHRNEGGFGHTGH